MNTHRIAGFHFPATSHHDPVGRAWPDVLLPADASVVFTNDSGLSNTVSNWCYLQQPDSNPYNFTS